MEAAGSHWHPPLHTRPGRCFHCLELGRCYVLVEQSEDHSITRRLRNLSSRLRCRSGHDRRICDPATASHEKAQCSCWLHIRVLPVRVPKCRGILHTYVLPSGTRILSYVLGLYDVTNGRRHSDCHANPRERVSETMRRLCLCETC